MSAGAAATPQGVGAPQQLPLAPKGVEMQLAWHPYQRRMIDFNVWDRAATTIERLKEMVVNDPRIHFVEGMCLPCSLSSRPTATTRWTLLEPAIT